MPFAPASFVSYYNYEYINSMQGGHAMTFDKDFFIGAATAAHQVEFSAWWPWTEPPRPGIPRRV